MSLLAFSLSLREGSYNQMLVNQACQILKELGADIECIPLSDYSMPEYNEDIEAKIGFPTNAIRLKDKLSEVKGIVLASPEYNYSYPGHFKNTFDWISRFRPMPWLNKSVLFLSASPSLVGGNRGLWHLRVPFEACGSFVYPKMFSLASAHEAFDEHQVLKNKNLTDMLNELLKAYFCFTENLSV